MRVLMLLMYCRIYFKEVYLSSVFYVFVTAYLATRESERVWGAKSRTLIAVGKQWVMLMSRIVIRACLVALPLALLLDRTIENVVLRDENDIKQQTDVCQAEFDRVARQSAPVCL